MIRFVLSGNLGFLWGSYLFSHFFKEFILKKKAFKFLINFYYLNHQINFLKIFYNACNVSFGSFFQIFYLYLRLGGYRTCVISDLFFKFI
jgi:hypothetical protein